MRWKIRHSGSIDKSSFASILTLFTKYQLPAGDWKARRGGLPDLSLSVDVVCAGTTGVWQICGKCQPADAGEKWSREDEWETELTKEEEDGDEESDDRE